MSLRKKKDLLVRFSQEQVVCTQAHTLTQWRITVRDRNAQKMLLRVGFYHILTICNGNTFHFQLNHLYVNKVSGIVMWLPMELITCFLFNSKICKFSNVILIEPKII